MLAQINISMNSLQIQKNYLFGDCLPFLGLLDSIDSSSSFYNMTLFISDSSHQSYGSSFSCSDTVVLSSMLSALTSPNLGSMSSFYCNSNKWVVNQCEGRFPAFCVNCQDPCSRGKNETEAFIINPCSAKLSQSPVAWTWFLQAHQVVRGPVFSITSVDSRQTEFVVHIQSKGPGYIACAASTSNFTSNEEIFAFGVYNESFADLSEFAITISGLIPDTHYFLQCASKGFKGDASPFDMGSKNRVQRSTLCCRPVIFTITNSSQLEGSPSRHYYLTTTMPYPPKVPFMIRFQVYSSPAVVAFDISFAMTQTSFSEITIPVPSILTTKQNNLSYHFLIENINYFEANSVFCRSNHLFIACPPQRSSSNTSVLFIMNATSSGSFNAFTNVMSSNKPVIVVNGPQYVKEGESLLVDLTQSSGSLGLRWKVISIKVFRRGVRFDNLELKGNQLWNRLPVMLQNRVPADSDLFIMVKMCNSLDLCGYGTYHVQSRSIIEGSNRLGNWFVGPNTVVPLKVGDAQRFMIVGEDSSNYVQTKHSWQIVDQQRFVRIPGFVSYQGLAMTSSYSLRPVKYYEVVAYANNVNHTLTRALRKIIQVKQGELKAVIAGGSYQLHGYSSDITIDGSLSYDEDYNPMYLSGINSGIRYQWVCYDDSPVQRNGCSLTWLTTSSQPSVSFRASPSQIDWVFYVQLRISDGKGRMSVAETRLQITSSLTTPDISLSEIFPRIKGKSRYLAEVRMKQLDGSAVGVWSDDENLAIPSTSLATPLLQRIQNSSSLLQLYYFDVVTSSLLASQKNYVQFSFTLLLSSSASSLVSSFSIPINAPPRNGSLVIQTRVNQTIQAMEEVVSLAAPQWFDEDLPLYYGFTYGLNDSCSPHCFYPLHLVSQLSYLYTFFPGHSSLNNITIFVSVEVFDTYDASSVVTQDISLISSQRQENVAQSPQSFDLISQSIEGSLSQLPYSPVLQYISATLFRWSMNSSNAGTFNLTRLNDEKVALLKQLYAVSTVTFVTEKSLLTWIHMLHDIITFSTDNVTSLSKDVRELTQSLLQFYLTQYDEMSSSFLLLQGNERTDVYEVLGLLYKSLYDEVDNNSTVIDEEMLRVNGILQLLSKIAFKELLPMMKTLPIEKHQSYLTVDYMVDQVNEGSPMILTSATNHDATITVSTSSSDASLIRIAVYQRKWPGDEALISNQTSLPVTMMMEDPSSTCSTNNCTVSVQMQNMEAQSYVRLEKKFYSMQCLYHEIKEEDVFCEESNRTIHVRCDGLFQGRINVTCPSHHSQPSCVVRLNQSSSFSSSSELFPVLYDRNITCTTVTYDAMSTSCACSLAQLRSLTSGLLDSRRKLQMQDVRGKYTEDNALTANNTQYLLSVLVVKEEVRSPLIVQYLHHRYNTLVPTNSSQYPEFILTVRTWMTLRNVSGINGTTLSTSNTSLFSSQSGVNLLSSSDQLLLKSILRQRVQENLKFFVTDVHYLNASYVFNNTELRQQQQQQQEQANNGTAQSNRHLTVTSLEEQQKKLTTMVLLFEIEVNVTNYCFLINALADLKHQLRTMTSNNGSSNIALTSLSPSAGISSALSQSVLTSLYVQLMSNLTLATNESFCALYYSAAPTFQPTFIDDTSGFSNSNAGLGVMSEFAKNPQFTLFFLIFVILFVLATLAYVILSNRSKPLISAEAARKLFGVEEEQFEEGDKVGDGEEDSNHLCTTHNGRTFPDHRMMSVTSQSEYGINTDNDDDEADGRSEGRGEGSATSSYYESDVTTTIYPPHTIPFEQHQYYYYYPSPNDYYYPPTDTTPPPPPRPTAFSQLSQMNENNRSPNNDEDQNTKRRRSPGSLMIPEGDGESRVAAAVQISPAAPGLGGRYLVPEYNVEREPGSPLITPHATPQRGGGFQSVPLISKEDAMEKKRRVEAYFLARFPLKETRNGEVQGIDKDEDYIRSRSSSESDA